MSEDKRTVRCDRCRFFEPYEDDNENGKIVMGACRRFPPSPNSRQESDEMYHPDGYLPPTVWSDGWCGEFQPRGDDK